MMVDLRRSTGIRHSRHGFFNSAGSKERSQAVAGFYGQDKLKF
jgi:hypothetical protein